MHFVLSYDLSLEAGARRNEIVSQIEGFLPVNNFVRRLSTFYVVHVNSEAEWNGILTNLSNLSRGIPEESDRIIVESLCAKYATKATIKESSLKGKVFIK